MKPTNYHNNGCKGLFYKDKSWLHLEKKQQNLQEDLALEEH